MRYLKAVVVGLAAGLLAIVALAALPLLGVWLDFRVTGSGGLGAISFSLVPVLIVFVGASIVGAWFVLRRDAKRRLTAR